jgi:hypothetical protein
VAQVAAASQQQASQFDGKAVQKQLSDVYRAFLSIDRCRRPTKTMSCTPKRRSPSSTTLPTKVLVDQLYGMSPKASFVVQADCANVDGKAVLKQLSDVYRSFLSIDPVPTANEDYEDAEPPQSVFDYSTNAASASQAVRAPAPVIKSSATGFSGRVATAAVAALLLALAVGA